MLYFVDKYKPTINQVNLTSCCKMPEDLVEFAKINNVQLTTHIDPMGNHLNIINLSQWLVNYICYLKRASYRRFSAI